MAALVAHEWPGNVRELENEMRRLVVMAGEDVTLEHLSSSVVERRTPGGLGGKGGLSVDALVDGGSIREAVAELEQRSIEAALEAAGGNKSQAAKSLGISRFALQRKLDKYGLGKTARAGNGNGDTEPGR
jgi:DNA-binding NtrC family response regulator